MAKFRAYRLRGVRAIYDNGLTVSISENYIEISKRDTRVTQEELKTWAKQYEITEEEFKKEFAEMLADFPEVKEVVNG